jgi:hypothetical protein
LQVQKPHRLKPMPRLAVIPAITFLHSEAAKLFFVKVHRVDDSNHSCVDGGVRAAHSSHCRKAVGGEQDALADARADGIQCEDGFAAIRAIQLNGLDHENLAAFVRSHFLRSDDVADDDAD